MASYESVTVTAVNITNQSLLYTVDSTTAAKTVDQRMRDILLEPLNIVLIALSLIGLVANSLSIIATLHIPHGQTTHSKLIINLAVSDICIILSVFLNVVEKVTSPLHLSTNCVEVANQAFLDFALLAILMNLLAMGIDHYIAIIKPMHYHQIMSNFRGNMIIVFIWIISLFGGFLDIIVGGFKETNSDESDNVDFCSKVYRDDFQAMLIIFGLVLVELVVLGYIYLCIFCEVRQLLKRGATLHQDDMHNKKAIITTLLIIGTFMVCLVPNSLFQLIVYILIHTDRAALMSSLHTILFIHNALWVLMLSNSICDPVIYALRLQDVQRGYKRMVAKLCILRNRKEWWEETRTFSRRNTYKLSISETEANEQQKQWTKNCKGINTPPTNHLCNNRPKDTSQAEEENDRLLFENHRNRNLKADDMQSNNRLVINMLSVPRDNKHTDDYNEDNVSEMTDLTPGSVNSDKPFLSKLIEEETDSM